MLNITFYIALVSLVLTQHLNQRLVLPNVLEALRKI